MEMFDYSVDSDEEWDEGGPGESLSGTDNEVESEDDYEVDNEFFVPHGYLSAEEENEDEEVENDPEKQKAILKQKQQEFDSERKKKTTELKPIILGCYFENSPATKDGGLLTFLSAYAAELLSDSPILTCFTVKKKQAEVKPTSSSASPNLSGLKKVPEKAMPYLIRQIHGNPKGKDTIVKDFQTFWQQHMKDQIQSKENSQEEPQPATEENASSVNPDLPQPDANSVPSDLISKRQLLITLNRISTYGKSPNPAVKRKCWWVHDEVREKYGLLDIPLVIETASKDDVEVLPETKKESASIKGFFKNNDDGINSANDLEVLPLPKTKNV